MSGEDVLLHATTAALGILTLALLLTIIRLVRGPTLPDRILALDLIATLAIGFIAAIAIRTGFMLYLDIAIAIGLLGFLSTIALARFVLKKAGTRHADAASEETGS
ncbi:MAG: cation:proton antiporter [Devosia sp.]|nr:cation:proton antiporter [Devosia sp.]